jgi:general secretion pathway protein D
MITLKLLKRGWRLLIPALVAAFLAAVIWSQKAPAQIPASRLPGQMPSSGGQPVVLKVYSYPPNSGNTILAQLRKAFENRPEVRLVLDARTNQLIVHGPEDCQREVSNYLSNFSSTGASRPAAPAPVRVAPSVPNVQNIALKNLSAWQLAQSLRNVVGSRLTAIPSPSQEANRYYLAMADQGGIELFLDYTSNRVTLQGAPQAMQSAARLIDALDSVPGPGGQETRLVSLQTSRPGTVKKMAAALAVGEESRAVRLPMAMKILARTDSGPEQKGNRFSFTPGESSGTNPAGRRPILLAQAEPGGGPPPEEHPDGPAAGGAGGPAGGLLGSVQVEMLEGLDVLVVRGNRRDVEQVMKIIEQIEKLSKETEPEIQVCPLRYVNSKALAELLLSLYNEVFLNRQGSVSITALLKPNALLLIGRQENVARVLELVKKLDQPASPDAEYHIFRLRQAAANTVADTLTELYPQTTGGQAAQPRQNQNQTETDGLAVRARITYDSRSNAVIVMAAPRDLEEIASIVERLDTASSEAVNELRVIQLQHSLASELVEVVQNAINAQLPGGRTTSSSTPGGPFGTSGRPGGTQGQTGTAQQRSAILQFFTRNANGGKQLKSGILSDVQVTADSRSNAILLSAPAESIDLLEALIKELDQLPGAEAQIKVFQIANGDATDMMNTLQTLFSAQGGTSGSQGGNMAMTPFGFVPVTGGAGESSTLVPLRFAVDIRTNCIIATGSADALRVVETLLFRLDESDVQNRITVVYRLKNAPTNAVAQAIQNFLDQERQVEQLAAGQNNALPFEQISREVVVVPEVNTNSLIVSTTPKYFEEIKKMVDKLDEQPPMVMIQVLIAEVTLNDTDELGVELGLQDSILFDRSSAGVPGFLFNNQQLGNNTAAANPNLTGTQGLSNFSMGRTNSDVGYGGFVFSASSESISVLIRALKDCNRLNVLSRPQIMTMDNQQANVMVGQQVPTVSGLQTNSTGGTQTGVQYAAVGVILQVWPRISPNDVVLMQIYAEKSDVATTGGIPIGVSNGVPITAPRIDDTRASTTISAPNGQTVVLGGLITKSRSEFHRKVPGLGDVPVLGRLFRYDSVSEKKTELLIILTPHVVRRPEDAEAIKRIEASRMNWCLTDVVNLMSDNGLRRRTDNWSDSEIPVIRPDDNPNAPKMSLPLEPGGNPNGESIPSPPGNPQGLPQGAAPGVQPVPPAPAAPGPPNLSREPAALPTPADTRMKGPSPAITPAAANVSPAGPNAVVHTTYDAPPQYPSTQTPYYR